MKEPEQPDDGDQADLLIEMGDITPSSNDPPVRIPARRAMRSTALFGVGAVGVGVTARVLATAAASTEDIASIADLFLNYTRFYLIVIFSLVFILGSGSAILTWSFWMPPVQDHTARAVHRLVNSCRACRCSRCRPGAEDPLSEQENAIVSAQSDPDEELIASYQIAREPGWAERISIAYPFLVFVTISCSVATIGLVANENEEAIQLLWGLQRANGYTVAYALITGLIAALYSGVTDLSSLWGVRRRPNALIYGILALGTLELISRTGFIIYLTDFESSQSRVVAFLSACFFTLSGTISNFLFQTSFAMEGSPFLARVRSTLVNMHPVLKGFFFLYIGGTGVYINLRMTFFNMSTLLPQIFNERLGFAISTIVFNGIAWGDAAGVAAGDFMSTFWDGVVSTTMGWDQPDNAFLRGERSVPLRMRLRTRRAVLFQLAPPPPRVEVLEEESSDYPFDFN